MKVVIVGKTKMHGGVCIGAIAIDSLESMRLIPPGQACNPTSTPFAIGDLWDVDIKKRRKSNRKSARTSRDSEALAFENA